MNFLFEPILNEGGQCLTRLDNFNVNLKTKTLLIKSRFKNSEKYKPSQADQQLKLGRTHCLFWPEVEVVVIVNVCIARMKGLILLLLGHLLYGQETVLSHLDPLGHVAHTGIL